MDKKDIIRFVARLTQFTLENRIEWRKVSQPSQLREGDLSSAVYVAELEGFHVYLYRHRRKTVINEHAVSIFNEPEIVDSFNEVILSVLDGERDPVFEAAQVSGLPELFDRVRARVSGFQDKIDSLVKVPA